MTIDSVALGPAVRAEADDFIRCRRTDYGSSCDGERIRLQRKEVDAAIIAVPDATDRIVAHHGHHVGVRVIRPDCPPRGVALDVHGGGWFTGRAAMNDQTNAALAMALGIAVVSVEYRLAPEWPFPAAVEDCVAAARWLMSSAASEFDTDRVVMIAESAGARPGQHATLKRVRTAQAVARLRCYLRAHELPREHRRRRRTPAGRLGRWGYGGGATAAGRPWSAGRRPAGSPGS